MNKEELTKKLQEKAVKIGEFAKSLHVEFAAKLYTDENGIKPVLVFKDNEKYEEINAEVKAEGQEGDATS